ncbi:hypothetical protein ACFYXS_21010 [Streptomyces sp. NPDC002574]|uniref:hypothetical protein n=1 Tax=Streptomyces sp. NPDC002574 TaxID=3364652 RepID=UPI00367623C6
MLGWAYEDRRRGWRRTALSALGITVDTAHQGRGPSYRMLEALREALVRPGR